MAEPNTAAPAGASEQAALPVIPDGPMDRTAAANLWAELEATPDPVAEATPGAKREQAIDKPPSDEDAPDPGSDAEEDAPQIEETAPEEDAEPAEEAETDADPEEEEYAHGNTRTRLRDGTVTTVGELKKLAEEAKEYRAKAPEFEAKQKELQERSAQIAQQEQFVQNVLPQALQILQAQLPQQPDPELVNPASPQYDPFAHYEQKTRYEQAVLRMQQMAGAIQAEQAARMKQLETAREAEHREYLQSNREALVKKVPDFAEPTKAKVLYERFVATATHYGFTKDDVNQVSDHRLLHMVYDLDRKAAAYDKLMAQKARVPVTVKSSAPPVQQPGRRVSAGETEQRGLNNRLQKWRDGGNRKEDAVEILADLQ